MHRFCGKFWSTDAIEQIRELIAQSPSMSRAGLSRRVCEIFDWRMLDGRLKEMSCRVAMLAMHRADLITLPAAQPTFRRPGVQFSSEASDPKPLLDVPLAALEGLKIELVKAGASLRLWNEFIARYHYLGYKAMPGAQLRYFIMDKDRVLGAMGFGAAAWKVAPRDRHIGWSSEVREKRLHLIVNQTRFLILPWVRCQNLATKTLKMALARLRDDWSVRYGYRPVLVETFVDTTKYRGTCYKAGNWLEVGATQGRSKYDRFHANQSPVKSVWLMPIQRGYQATLTAMDAG